MNLQEQIRKVLKEESKNTSLQDKLLQVIKSKGVKRASKLVGGVERLFRIIDMKGTQDGMIFLTKAIMENEVKERLKYCSYNIVPTRYSINVVVFIPKPSPEDEGRWSRDYRVREEAKDMISQLLWQLGGGLIRGHNIEVSNTGNC